VRCRHGQSAAHAFAARVSCVYAPGLGSCAATGEGAIGLEQFADRRIAELVGDLAQAATGRVGAGEVVGHSQRWL
jgi:hypothetical protein